MLSHFLYMLKPFWGSPSFFTWSSNSLAYFWGLWRPSSCSHLWLRLLPPLRVYHIFLVHQLWDRHCMSTVIAISLRVKTQTFWTWLRALQPRRKPQLSSLSWFHPRWPFSSLEKPHPLPLRPFAGMLHPSYHTPTQFINFFLPIRSQLNQIITS